jgi:hypothetical protein
MGLVVLVQLSDIESGGSVFEGFAVFGKRGTIEFKKGFGLRWTLNAFVWKRRRCCLQAEGSYSFLSLRERERERESCWSLSGYPAYLPAVEGFSFFFYHGRIFLHFIILLIVFFLFNYFILFYLRVFK